MDETTGRSVTAERATDVSEVPHDGPLIRGSMNRPYLRQAKRHLYP